MNKTKKSCLPTITIFSFFLFILAFNFTQADNIIVESPITPTSLTELVTLLRSHLLYLVGGIAIVFIAISGILHILGGALGQTEWITKAKKTLVWTVSGLVIILSANMIISELNYIVTGTELNFDNLSATQILVRLINFLLAIVGALFLISMIIGGIWYFTASTDESKVELGKKTVRGSIIGITIALAAMVILRQIEKIITG
ncbi:MAG: hypothetical protein V1690_00015 [Candidatus Moraniibacteriota bacterium]